ncbi:MAG: dTDP-4-dehydrorhamnose reductase [Planctomycetes bacterium]|nr:dTDP-4-dehydrorhamnose reductase [Planctomycetota bacterium]
MTNHAERPILVTGANGMLAGALRRRFGLSGGPAAEVIWTDVDELNITDEAAVRQLVERRRCGVIINCAGLTQVDDCQSRRDEAMLINGRAVGHLARAAEAVGALLVQISTDFVFGGNTDKPYVEDDPPQPLNVYGESKLLGEEQARLASEHLVVRTSWLYGLNGRNFVRSICRQAALGRSLTVVDDQVGCPTYTGDLAEAIVRLLACGARGMFHACGGEATSWFDFARAIVRLRQCNVAVEPVSSAKLGRPAKRPAMSVLDCTRLYDATGYRLPGFGTSLPVYLAEMKSGEDA